LDEARFEAEGIKVIYQSYNPQAYPQIYGDFIPCLSAIDMLFNCGENSRNILMKDNLTKEEILISGRQNNAKK
jgi:hypothetical protein